jgi:hypothetical protein
VSDKLLKQCSVLWACADYDPSIVASFRGTTTGHTDNIKMDVQEVGGGHGDWMESAQDRDGWRALVSTVKNVRVP